MVSDAVHDKDAVGATLLICEVLHKQRQRKQYLKLLTVCYHGFYKESLISLTKD
jgi:phosphomannomutase